METITRNENITTDLTEASTQDATTANDESANSELTNNTNKENTMETTTTTNGTLSENGEAVASVTDGMTQEEIADFKDMRATPLTEKHKDDFNSYAQSEEAINSMVDENKTNARIKVTAENGECKSIFQHLLDNVELHTEDLLEPELGTNQGVIKHSNFFDAYYKTSLRGGEKSKVLYESRLIPQYTDAIMQSKFAPKNKSKFVKSCQNNLLLSNPTGDELVAIEKKFIEWRILDKDNTFIRDFRRMQKLQEEDVKNSIDNEVAEIFKDYAMVFDNGYLKLVDVNTHKRYGVQGFKSLFANRKINVGGKWRNPVDLWLESDNRKVYDGFTFDPSSKENGDLFNTFKGFKYEAKPLIDITPFKNFVKGVVSGGDEEMYNIVWSWIAQIIQNPASKMGTALVLISDKGAGKGTFVSTLGELFSGYYMSSSDHRRLLGNFNIHLKNNLLFYANELTFKDNQKVVAQLKNITTETDFTYEEKKGDTTPDKNYTHIIIDSNEPEVVEETEDERRFIYPSFSNSKIGDIGYFDVLHTFIKSKGFFESLMYDLQNFDYSKWEQFLRKAPKNEVSQEQLLANAPLMEKWWMYCLEEGVIPHTPYDVQYDGTILIANESLFNSFIKFNGGRRCGFTDSSFGLEFKKLTLGDRELCLNSKQKITLDGYRKNASVYATLSKCREAFAKKGRLFNTDELDMTEEWSASSIA